MVVADSFQPFPHGVVYVVVVAFAVWLAMLVVIAARASRRAWAARRLPYRGAR